jgi:hypothetical protein
MSQLVPTMLLREEFALSMVQSQNCAVMSVAPTMSSRDLPVGQDLRTT